MITPPDSAPQAPPQMPASTFGIQAPYAAGSPQQVAGPGIDDVGGSVAEAQANAMARQSALAQQTHEQGSEMGVVTPLPAQTTTGSTGGAFYDPPRDYGEGA